MTTAIETLKAQLDSDVRLQPGEEGYWKIWGARTVDVEMGDIIVTLVDGEMVFDLVAELRGNGIPSVRYTNQDGKNFSIGCMSRQAWTLFRQGTHNTLAGSIR